MQITDLIPQRAPFLFLDDIIETEKDRLISRFTFREDLDFFKGHFPSNPIVPGVILNEACFQSAAALISLQSEGESSDLAVVSRIQNAKFKQIVRPGETILIETQISEQLGNAAYFKSIVKNAENKKVLTIEFACTLVKE